MGNYPTCEKSGLLISRCRCPKHRIPRRRHHPYLSRHQRERQNRHRFVDRRQIMGTREWMNEQWRVHAMQHPEMWSQDAKDFLLGVPDGRNN